jgi:hypothetical protein
MLWTIFVVLLILWLLGFSLHVAGGLIHLLLVVALVVLVINLLGVAALFWRQRAGRISAVDFTSAGKVREDRGGHRLLGIAEWPGQSCPGGELWRRPAFWRDAS